MDLSRITVLVALLWSLPLNAGAAVIYSYAGGIPVQAGGIFSLVDQVSGWAVFDAPLPPSPVGLQLVTVTPLDWEFRIKNFVVSPDTAGLSASFRFGGINGIIAPWSVLIAAPVIQMQLEDFGDQVDMGDGSGFTRGTIGLNGDWTGPTPFDTPEPSVIALFSLTLAAWAIQRRRSCRGPSV